MCGVCSSAHFRLFKVNIILNVSYFVYSKFQEAGESIGHVCQQIHSLLVYVINLKLLVFNSNRSQLNIFLIQKHSGTQRLLHSNLFYPNTHAQEQRSIKK